MNMYLAFVREQQISHNPNASKSAICFSSVFVTKKIRHKVHFRGKRTLFMDSSQNKDIEKNATNVNKDILS